MIDPFEAFLAHLASDPALTAYLTYAGRSLLYGAPTGLDPEAFDPATGLPLRALTVRPVGGMIARSHQIFPIFYLIAYGPTPVEANQVLLKVHDFLYDARGDPRCNVTIAGRWFMYWARFEALGDTVVERDSKWPVAFAPVHTKFDAKRGEI